MVAPIERSEVVRFLPATVSAFASAGGAATVGAKVGDGDAVAVAEGDGEADAAALGVGEELGVGVDFATGLAGAFLTGFFGGFFALFLLVFFTGGFFAARARSPRNSAEATPATMAMNFRRPPLSDGVFMANRLIPFDCCALMNGYTVGSHQLHHKPGRAKLAHYRPIRRNCKNLLWATGIFHIAQSPWSPC